MTKNRLYISYDILSPLEIKKPNFTLVKAYHKIGYAHVVIIIKTYFSRIFIRYLSISALLTCLTCQADCHTNTKTKNKNQTQIRNRKRNTNTRTTKECNCHTQLDPCSGVIKSPSSSRRCNLQPAAIYSSAG